MISGIYDNQNYYKNYDRYINKVKLGVTSVSYCYSTMFACLGTLFSQWKEVLLALHIEDIDPGAFVESLKQGFLLSLDHLISL